MFGFECCLWFNEGRSSVWLPCFTVGLSGTVPLLAKLQFNLRAVQLPHGISRSHFSFFFRHDSQDTGSCRGCFVGLGPGLAVERRFMAVGFVNKNDQVPCGYGCLSSVKLVRN